MQFVNFAVEDGNGIGLLQDQAIYGYAESNENYPGSLEALIREDRLDQSLEASLLAGDHFDPERITYLPPVVTPDKIICVGLNYLDHSQETGFKPPKYPAIFCRFASSLVAHRQAIVKPGVSDTLDFEGELAAVIGRGGRHIPEATALDHVVGYSVFNDASIRDYQTKSPQWTMGKNFDGTGAFGPYLVTTDELPLGCKGLQLQTRLNGKVMQSANTDDLIFDVATLIATISEVMTLAAGDVIVTGTPAGIGWARKPPVFMQADDVCEVEIEKVGLLCNQIVVEN